MSCIKSIQNCLGPIISLTKAVFGSCKSISGKYSIFQKCYFPERKMFSCVWLHFKKFSRKYFLVFGKEEGKDKPGKKSSTIAIDAS